MNRLMNGNNINHFFILKLYTFPITRYDNTLFSSNYRATSSRHCLFSNHFQSSRSIDPDESISRIIGQEIVANEILERKRIRYVQRAFVETIIARLTMSREGVIGWDNRPYDIDQSVSLDEPPFII